MYTEQGIYLSQWWVELSLTWLDCLQIDSEGFIFFADINQILLKISCIPILLTFMYLCSSTLSENRVVNSLKSSQARTQLIIVTDNNT